MNQLLIQVVDFSLDNFVPSRKGYFAYSGTLPYDPCNGDYSYVVYKKEDGLNISSTGLTKLKKIIKKTISTVKKNSVFYNKKGQMQNIMQMIFI